MLYKTHLLIGIIILYLSKIMLGTEITMILVILTILASLFPDIDEKHSKLGKHFKIVSFIFDHRGLFHTIWFAIIFSIIIHELVGMTEGIIFFAIYLSHLASDAMTKQGIKLFYPINLTIKGNIKVGSLKEKIFFILLMILLMGLIAYDLI